MLTISSRAVTEWRASTSPVRSRAWISLRLTLLSARVISSIPFTSYRRRSLPPLLGPCLPILALLLSAPLTLRMAAVCRLFVGSAADALGSCDIAGGGV